MTEFYRKKPLLFSLVLIALYVFGASVTDALSLSLGVVSCITLPFLLLFSVVLLIFLHKNRLLGEYGFTYPRPPYSRYLYFLPLLILASVNVWLGVRMSMPLPDTLCYVGSMLLVGLLEELIFRGFLFRAILPSGVRTAVIVSSLTFGIGHFVNLINGSGAQILDNALQVLGAVAFGFLFVAIYYRGGSLIPCILTHSLLNALSAFSNEEAMQGMPNILLSGFLCIGALLYTLWLCRVLPLPTADTEGKES